MSPKGRLATCWNCTAATVTSRWRWHVISIAYWPPKSPNRRWRRRDHNIAANHIDNVQIIRMAAEEFTQAMTVRQFNRLRGNRSA